MAPAKELLPPLKDDAILVSPYTRGFLLIGRCNYFGFDFTSLDLGALIEYMHNRYSLGRNCKAYRKQCSILRRYGRKD